MKGYLKHRWSRGHKARGQGQGQGHKKNPRSRTAFPRTDTLEAKDRNARGQGKGSTTQAQVLSKKKKVFTKIFQAISTKKRFPKNFSGQANFRGLEASRPRTSKCVLEAKDVLEDSTSDLTTYNPIKCFLPYLKAVNHPANSSGLQ